MISTDNIHTEAPPAGIINAHRHIVMRIESYTLLQKSATTNRQLAQYTCRVVCVIAHVEVPCWVVVNSVS
jgi:hypothetical protein